MKISLPKSSNFFNDVVRVSKWFINGWKKGDHSRLRGFFSKIYREMKR